MKQDAINENHKDILRKIVKADDEGSLHQKGKVLAIRGDDEYQIFGCQLHLASLADLDALCDASFLFKERGGLDPEYRITDAGRVAVMNDFQHQSPELQQIDQLIAMGTRVIDTAHPIEGMPMFKSPDASTFSEWESRSINFLTRICGEKHPYFQQFRSKGDPSLPGALEGRFGVLKAVRQEIISGNLLIAGR